MRRLQEMLRRFGHEWGRDNAALLSAGVAFYAIFSVAPLVSLMMSAASLLLGGQAAQQHFVGFVRQFVGPNTAAAIARISETVAARRSSGLTIVTIVLLLAGASAVFRHLRAGLDIVMDVPPSKRAGWLQWILSRAIAVAMVIGMIAFLLLSLAATAALALAARFVPAAIAQYGIIWWIADFLVSALLVACLAMVALRWVPDIRLPGRSIVQGALVTTVLFSIGRYAVSLYLSHAEIVDAYGAAGSLLVVLFAVYFAVVALFAGAEAAELHARRDPEFAGDREEKQSRPGYVPRKEERAPV